MSPIDIDMCLMEFATEKQKIYLDAIKKHGSGRKAAISLGLNKSTVIDAINALKSKNYKKEKSFSLKIKSKIFVVTSAQNATPIHSAFFESLKNYCEENKAQLIVIPYRYKNPTSIFSNDAQEDDYWDAKTVPYLLNTRLKLSNSITILADIKTQPTAVSPLSGMETLSGSASAVIGHPRLELTTIATPQKKLPKILTTTGACTMANYSDTKAGKKGDHHHTYGACIIEIDGDVFHLRQINAVHDGSFIDLNRNYTDHGSSIAPPPSALVLGDLHAEVRDHIAMKCTFGNGGIVHTLKPKHIVYHDLIDFTSRNHHNIKDPFFRYARHHSKDRKNDNVEMELREAFSFLDSITPKFSKNVIVASNHIDALGRWVREFNPQSGDYENALFWAKTYCAMLENSQVNKTIDPLTYWAKQWMKSINKSIFLGRGESFSLHGIELAMHGDKGPNGARGTRNAFTKIGVKSVIGHSHSPGISGGVYQVGTNSRLDLDYAIGSPSSWLHTDCIIYANGKRSLINIIGNKWRCKK